MVQINAVTELNVRDGIAVITVDNPPVNALGQTVRAGLLAATKQALANDAVQAIVLGCGGRTFFAGADITEFGKPFVEPYLDDVINAFEASPKPVVAAMFGTALGGGHQMRSAGSQAWAVARRRRHAALTAADRAGKGRGADHRRRDGWRESRVGGWHY
jgi:3-hydroxyacyl-CoA dehydrogenase